MPFDAAPPNDVTTLDGFLASIERRAFRFAELSLGHRDEALDCVQDAMMKFVAYRQRPCEEWNPLFWSILRRQITDRHRRSAVRNRWMHWFGGGDDEIGDPIERIADPRESPDQRQLEEATWQALGEALRALPRRQREAFMLRELEGLDVAQTAAAMNCSAGSVKTHLFRAHEKLRDALEDWR